MRILVVSDSHGNMEALRRAVARAGSVVAILHAGDEVCDADALRREVRVPVISVAGNWDRADTEHPLWCVIDSYGPRVLLTHGHTLGVKRDLTQLLETAGQHKAAVALYGHTHRYAVGVHNGVLVMNPGSCAQPRAHQDPTFGMLEIQEQAGAWMVTASVITLRGTLVDWGELRVRRHQAHAP